MSWIAIEAQTYWAIFAVMILAVALWEMLRPWRAVSEKLVRRWRNHAGLLAIYTGISLLLYRGSAVALAVAAEHNRFGILNRPWLPLAVRCILAFLLLDLLRYGLHRALHSVPLLWRAHQVHHSDPDLDLSTGFRNHPLEGLFVHAIYYPAIALFAAPPVAVLAVELAGVVQEFVSHANASLPVWIEKPLRRIFVTPEMHRVHHSDEISEQNANLGDLFPWWDRIFGTYVDVPAAGLDGMKVGLKGFQDERSSGLLFMLAQPFRPSEVQEPLADTSPARAAGD